jgi:phage gp36-like protein
MAIYIENEQRARAAAGESFDGLYNLPADSSKLEADILAAETEVDSHLRRYQLPLSDERAISYVRTALVSPIFAEHAWINGAGDEIPKKISDAAKTARSILEKLRKGEVDLAGVTVAETSTGGGALIVQMNEPQFNRDNMESF